MRIYTHSALKGLKRNVTEKLRERGIPRSVAEEFVANVFGKRSGCTYEEGLIDSMNQSNFRDRLERWQAVWESIQTCWSVVIS